MLWHDIAAGLLVAGAFAAWVPDGLAAVFPDRSSDPRDDLGRRGRPADCRRVIHVPRPQRAAPMVVAALVVKALFQ